MPAAFPVRWFFLQGFSRSSSWRSSPKRSASHPIRYVRPHAIYTTLLMSTGLTFGTISALYGLNGGIIDRAQFSVSDYGDLLSAIVPTLVAQRILAACAQIHHAGEEIDVEDESSLRVTALDLAGWAAPEFTPYLTP